jgi:hypothetical protein
MKDKQTGKPKGGESTKISYPQYQKESDDQRIRITTNKNEDQRIRLPYLRFRDPEDKKGSKGTDAQKPEE